MSDNRLSGLRSKVKLEHEIRTDRVTLRPLRASDLETYKAYAMDAENTRYMCFLPKLSESESREFLESAEAEWRKTAPGFCEYAVIYEGRHVGGVGIYLEDGVGELSWIIDRQYQRKGLAYEAVGALTDYFAREFGIKRFCAHCDTENTASFRLMEKLGMKRTGVYGGRKNRLAGDESFEYLYELERR